MSRFERLQTYYDFDSDVLEAVDETAQFQNRLSFASLAEYFKMPDGPKLIHDTHTGKTMEFLHFEPFQDYDNSRARVYHLPMAMPADESMAMRGMRLFGSDQTIQLFMVGNPAAIGRSTGTLSHGDAARVWRGDLSPTVNPTLAYLAAIGITSVESVGFSYGADKAAAAAASEPNFGISESRSVLMEPASVVNRGINKLLRDFASAGGDHLQRAVSATGSQPYFEARQLADSGITRYAFGLLRLSNLAIAHSLARDGFEHTTECALTRNKQMRATIAWGSESEISPGKTMQGIADRLQKISSGRVASMELTGMHHADGDDIDLHAAIVLQALRLPRQ